jgi:hypothetical protein
MDKGLAGIGVILLLFGMSVFVGTGFRQTTLVAVEVPYSEEVPYVVEVESWALEPYEVEVPYEGNVSVTRETPLYENSSILEYNGLVTCGLELGEGLVSIEWSSDKHIRYFAFMGAERWDVIWSDFQWKYGVVASVVLVSGGILLPLAIYYFDRFIENCTEYVAEPEDYYEQNSLGGSAVRLISGGEYVVVVYNTESSANETMNSYRVVVSGLHNETEVRTFYRNETAYRNVSCWVNETRFRLEEGVRFEEREVERRLLELPELGALGWGQVSGGAVLAGFILLISARRK